MVTHSLLKFALCAVVFGSTVLSAEAQILYKPGPSEIAEAPLWAQKMYTQNPNVWEVQELYSRWITEEGFEKSFHTQYYKRWMRAAQSHVNADGFIHWPTPEEERALEESIRAKENAAMKGGTVGWSVIGPIRVYDSGADFEADQTNVYSLSICDSDTTVMYCGTETGMILKSTDTGESWQYVSMALNLGGVTAVEVDPTDPDIAFAGSGSKLWRTTDGGGIWNEVYSTGGLNANEILVNPSNHNLVMVAGDAGLFRSTDGGTSWVTLYSDDCYDLKLNAASNGTVYLLKNNPIDIRSEFFISTDTGATFTVQLAGWYSSTDPARYDGGSRLAVTEADPNRIYAYLIGESKSGDNGFIGVYKSTDGGYNWTLPNPPAGGPYSAAHPNMATGTLTWTYHQGFYNCALMASNTDPDRLIIGGLSLYLSTDGGVTSSSIAGYAGGPLSMHVDNQDFRAINNTYWISTDGGIYKSADCFASQPEVKMNGIHGSDYWGFGQGWNEDVLVGGLYHNGNLAYYQDYAAGEFLSLGGGEAPTGYVRPGNNRHTYFSDIGGRVLPVTIGDPVGGTAFSLAPNESYWAAESSELEWHPNCYSIGWLGRDHKLWKTMDAGATFSLVDSFGTNANARISYIEISRSNPEVMYMVQRPASGTGGILRRTDDGGTTWNTILIPGSGVNKNRILIALSPDDEDHLWLAYPSAGNGNKIWKTTNGGSSWSNITTSTLDNEEVHSIAHTGGTDGGVYYFSNWNVYYRNNTMSDWVLYDASLPYRFDTDIGRVFYRDGKVRSATYGKGIWEAPLYENPSRPVACAMVDEFMKPCTGDSFYFEDHSMLNHSGAAWAWTFQDGSPATSSLRNPTVAFTTYGIHEVTLTVTDSAGNASSDTIYVENTGISATGISEDFETLFPPMEWEMATGGPLSWTLSTTVGGFGLSSQCAVANNYDIDAGGTWADMRAPVDFGPITAANLTFDVAYTPWGGIYSDTLEVLVSTDCGQTFNLEYRKGGMDLSTLGAPLNSAPFVPFSTHWRTDTVDLNAYAGSGPLYVVFRNWGHFGQLMYIDNINLNATVVGQQPAVQAQEWFALAPNPVSSADYMTLAGTPGSICKLRIYDMSGKETLNRTLTTGEQIAVSSFSKAAGVYGYSIEGRTVMQTGKVVVVEGR